MYYFYSRVSTVGQNVSRQISNFKSHNEFNPEKSQQIYNKALSIFKTIGDRRGEARVLRGIGLTLYGQGQNKQAMKKYEEALRIFKEIGDKRRQATTLGNIGFICKEQGLSDDALIYLKQAKKAFECIGEAQAAKIASNAIDEIEKKQ